FAGAAGYGGTALGSRADAAGDYTVAIGGGESPGTGALPAAANNTGDVAVGTASVAGVSGGATTYDTAMGYGAQATGGRPGVWGYGASATNAGGVAIGAGAQAPADPATALGNSAIASGNNSLALGASATAGAANSVALGAGSVANEANTVSVGS